MSEERSANAVDGRLGQRVRARRLKIGMSQERLAELLGVTFQQVQKYEKGVNRMAASRLLDVSRALDMPVAKFFEGLSKGGKSGSDASSALETALTSPQVVDLVRTFVAIKDGRVRRRVLELVRTMKDGD